MDQLNLFDEINPGSFAVIFCSCIMEDQFGVIWERQEIFKTDLSEVTEFIFQQLLENSKLG